MKFDPALYATDEPYVWHKKYAEGYEMETGLRLFGHYKPKCVLDLGCGIGTYLCAAKMCGAIVKGYEIGGEYAKKYADSSVVDDVVWDGDITKKLHWGLCHFDMVLCVEVAEHIGPEGSEQLIDNISGALAFDGLCVWTAAPPGQEGHAHINCQPKEYWLKLFAGCGLYPSKEETKVRELITGSPDYIMRNLVVLSRRWSEKEKLS